ncbi:MAG TPA: DUF128 domain-containing protein [Deltaproteobacteria bacterium]|nr:DUF128 domain-containing protein [Deltaproteobacteria bacterium]
MQTDTERKVLAILRVLEEARSPLGARVIARRLKEFGISLTERAVRYHLQLMDERGFTRCVGRRQGREITERGLEELKEARVGDKVGFAISRIEILAFKTTFDPRRRRGVIPINVSLFPKEIFSEALEAMRPAFEAGICVSSLVAVREEGETLGEIYVPEDRVGFATVCSVVLNGVLLKAGVPMSAKFGGILQVKDRAPVRFVELIHYAGSSLDPSEAFIRAKMTSVREVAEVGEGKILANFREVPAPCKPLLEEVVKRLKGARIGGVLEIGEVGRPVCEIPVDENKVGVILLGGLNPVACAQEEGIEAENFAMSTTLDFRELTDFWEVYRRSRG